MKLFLFAVALLAITTKLTFASFHLNQIEQVIGGVDGDTTAQAIQMRMRLTGENFVSGVQLVAFDAQGSNAVVLITIPGNVANSAAGSRILLTTSNFVQYTSLPLASDFTLTTPIPTSYLAAGRLCWTSAGTIYWSLSWGGAGYTGSNTGSTFNDADGNFGPPFSGPLPSTSTQALRFTNSFSAASVNNAADYAVTPTAAVLNNNSGSSFTVISTPQVTKPQVTSVARESNDLRITWATTAGRTNFVQATAGDVGGGFTTNFVDVSGPIVVSGSDQVVTNYLDSGGATNVPARYYRVRLVP